MKRALASAAALLASGCFYDFNNVINEVKVGEIRGETVREEPGTGKLIPASGAQILVRGTNLVVESDQNGRFSVLDLPPTGKDDAYTVVARYSTTGSKQYDLVKVMKGITLAPGDGRNLGKVVVEKTGTISGFVKRKDLDETTDQHAGTFVGIPGTPFATTTFEDGFYAIALLGADLYDVAAWRRGYTLTKLSKEVHPGETAVAELVKIDLQLSTETAVVSVNVRLGGQAPRTDTPVTVLLVEAARSVELASATNAGPPATWSFTVDEVPAGVYTLRASAPGYKEVYLTNVVADPARAVNSVDPIVLFKAGGDCDGDHTPDDLDFDDDNDGISDVDEPGCECYPDIGRAYACLGTPQCRPALTAGQNAVPVAVAGCDVLATPPDRRVVLDGSKSFDADGDPLQYKWRVIQDPGPSSYTSESSSEASYFAFRPRQHGEFRVELTVDDGKGLSMPAIAVVTVDATNSVPTFITPLEGGSDLYTVLPGGLGATLQGPEATDPNGIVGYAWVTSDGLPSPLVFVGEPSASTRSPRLAGVPPVGTYRLDVYAIDGRGAFSEPAHVHATLLESSLANSVFVDDAKDGCGVPCTGGGVGTLNAPFCLLTDALAATAASPKDIYVATGCFQPKQLPAPIACVEGRSLYGGFVPVTLSGGTFWERDAESFPVRVETQSGSEVLRCVGDSAAPITPATIIDGFTFRLNESNTEDGCLSVQAVLIANYASPTFSRNHVEFGSVSHPRVIGVNIKAYASPVLLDNVIAGENAPDFLVGIRMADGANAFIAHNTVQISDSLGGGRGLGSIGLMIRADAACGFPQGRCSVVCFGVGRCCSNSASLVDCINPISGFPDDALCSEPSRATIVDNIIELRQLAGARRYGVLELGNIDPSPQSFENNLLLVEGTDPSEFATYVDHGFSSAPPGFCSGPDCGTRIYDAPTLNALPEAHATSSNLLADPQLGGECAFCLLPTSPAIAKAKRITVPGAQVDHKNRARPGPDGKPDIGAIEFYPNPF